MRHLPVFSAITLAASAEQGLDVLPQGVSAQLRRQFGDFDVVVQSVDKRLAEEAFEVECRNRTSTVRGGSRRGILFGIYELARTAGYGFLHPSYPVEPDSPRWCQTLHSPAVAPKGRRRKGSNQEFGAAVRGTHLHTQHPIELADVLNGVGQGGNEEETAWAAGLPAWTLYLQWLVANKQNLVEWALLEWPGSDGFSTSDVRQRRLRQIVDVAHEWGLRVSIDAPFNLQQQHAWRLQTGEDGGGWEAIAGRLNWLCNVGVDMVSTEIGSTEFSKTDPGATIELLNSVAAYLGSRGKQLVVKNHASTSQFAKGYKDPLDPSKDLNFNYITYYADERVISAPHTVQMYSLADPLVGSYGRYDYADVRAMMGLLEKEGKPQVFFPETAYWVDFDISVPIFLPLYAADRLRDVEILASEAPSAGHLNFESGWSFGYWLNNAAQAWAAWHRGPGLMEPELSSSPAGPVHSIFRQLLAPLGPLGSELADLLASLTALQNRTLVQDTFLAPDGRLQTLVGYLEGWEGMAELQEAWQIAVVQPARVHPRDVASHAKWYDATLAPRLRKLEEAARPLAATCRALRGAVVKRAGAKELVTDVCVGVELFHLRVRQVCGIYAAAAGAAVEEGLETSRSSIAAGLALVAELNLSPQMTGWTGTPAPTSYPFGYLWSAANLFFWRRDHQIVARGVREACYLNLYDPVEIGLPASSYKGGLKRLARFLGAWMSFWPYLHSYSGCLSGPAGAEPELDPVLLEHKSLHGSKATGCMERFLCPRVATGP